MRISDWSSDVCSSDLAEHRGHLGALVVAHRAQEGDVAEGVERRGAERRADEERRRGERARLQEAGGDGDRAAQNAGADVGSAGAGASTDRRRAGEIGGRTRSLVWSACHSKKTN